MSEILAVTGLAVATFVSTSVDNLLLLVGFYGEGETPRVKVGLGYIAATVTMLAVAWAASSILEEIPAQALGLLGVIPLMFGVAGLSRLARSGGVPPEDRRPASSGGFAPVFLVMAANSGDSLAVFASLFGDTAERTEVVIAGTAALCAVAYTVLAARLTAHPVMGARIRRAANVVLPILLIAIGIYIMADTGTDSLP